MQAEVKLSKAEVDELLKSALMMKGVRVHSGGAVAVKTMGGQRDDVEVLTVEAIFKIDLTPPSRDCRD